jgi:aspartokinase
MIIMKFGGTSLASTQSLRRVVSIVASELHRRPVVVASAIGNTTDVLLDLLTAARRGNSYRCWKLQDALKDQHFSIASDLLSDKSRQVIDDYLCRTFRDLHIRMLELYEGERVFTPELQDWTLSLGEQLASRLLAAVLQNDCCPTTTHLDARTLILTDESFTRAQPRYWETYARAVGRGATFGET